MVESDDDFAELCSKLLKRVKKTNNNQESQNVPKVSTTARGNLKKAKPTGTKKRRKDGGSKEAEVGIIPGPAGDKPDVDREEKNDTVQNQLTNDLQKAATKEESQEGDPRPHDQKSVKDLVLERMQQFKRAPPSRMRLDSTEISAAHVGSSTACPSVKDDGALALQMDVKEKPASLEDQGLFFCQLCQKDLTAMSSALREQHVNRCLDQVENLGGGSVTPAVPGCPLCGKPFSTEKSRASHLKRCAAKLEVPAQTLLQAVQRQAAEEGSEVPPRVVSGKRKGIPKQKAPSKKRKTAQTGAEMEDLMVAMALSRSMQEEKKAQNTAGGPPSLELPAREKKGRRKQKDKPTPLLLVQAPEETAEKLQKRLSVLLTEEAMENSVTTLPPSHFWTMEEEERESRRLRGGNRCVLWDISNMVEERDPLSYYTAELNPPISPWKSPVKKLQSSQSRADTSILHPGKPQNRTAADKDLQPGSSEEKTLLSDSQKALLDLAELAGEGMTLTQWNGGAANASERTGRESPVSITFSGFIPVQEEKMTKENRVPNSKIPLLVLSADFKEMVNNPHLSDAQLQTDCGEVLNAHMFVLYARCPLLVEAIHSEGFWVDESGLGRARRLLLNDVTAEAALCFLRFLYSATTDVPDHCLPHVSELARRFGVKSLIDTCECLISGTHNSEGDISTEEEGDDGGERAETFQELLKSMWMEEGGNIFEDLQVEGEDEEKLDDGGVGEGELEEIYEFALIQRKILAEQDSEGGNESEHQVTDQDKSEGDSPKSRNLNIEEVEKMDLISTTPLKASPNPKDMPCSPRRSPACILSNSPEYALSLPIASSAQLKTRSSPSYPAAPVQSPKLKSADASPVKPALTSNNTPESPIPVISLISPNRDEDPEADMFSHNPPSLDDSYDRMFSQTCGEYGEPSDIGESKSQMNPDTPQDQQPILTSSPTAMPCPTLPELESSLNIRPQTNSFLEPPSSSAEHGKSLHSSLKDSHHSTPTQNSKASSHDADIILILSSDEEMESNDQAAAPTTTLCKAIKESPVSFTQRRNSEGFSCLEMSSSSEMSWLVPATPLHQSASSKISLLQTSCLPQSPQTLQKTSIATQSPPDVHKTSLAMHSLQALQKTSHVTQSLQTLHKTLPKNLQKTSHAAQSSPDLQKISHAALSPLKSQRISHPTLSPPYFLMSHVIQSPPSSQQTPHTALSPQKTSHAALSTISPQKTSSASSPLSPQKTSHSSSPLSPQKISHASSPLSSQKMSHASSSPPNSQKTPQSSPRSRNLDRNISSQSFVSQTQASPVSLPSMSPRTPRSLRPSILEKLEAQSSGRSKVASSPPISIVSSTVFEVQDSDDEAPIAEPQANISNTSFQFDYDEPPIPMDEDLWCSMHQTPRKSYSPPAPSSPLQLNKTPTKSSYCKPHSPSPTKSPLELMKTPTKSSYCKPLSPSPAKSTSSGSIEVSPQTRVSQSSHQSYLNSRLWGDWEEEDPELPAVFPLSERLKKVPEVQKELRTPVSIVRRRELAPKVPITPLPDYSDMDTPNLKKELTKFGVRALPKKKMVLKLKEIFRYTHQVMSSDSEDDVPSSRPRGGKGGSVAEASQEPTRDKRRPQNTAKGSSSSHVRRKGTSTCAAQEEDAGDDRPLTASQESTTSSVGASDTSSLSQSSNTNEFETAFADEDDDEPMAASQAASKEALTTDAIRRFIEARPDLRKQILLYQPLDLAALHAELKLNGIKVAAGKLLDFLDSHCVTFTTATARKEKKSRGRRKVGKRY